MTITFASVAAAIFAGFEISRSTATGYDARTRTPDGWDTATVNLTDTTEAD